MTENNNDHDRAHQDEAGAELLHEHLELVDKSLIGTQVPLPERPLRATLMLAATVVLDVRGDEKSDNPSEWFKTKWFASLYEVVRRWYLKRYGSLLISESRPHFGAIVYRGSPILIEIPAVVLRPADDRDQVWICFPDTVLPDEEALAWLRPVLSPQSEIWNDQQLKRDVVTISERVRQIHNSLLTTRDPIDSPKIRESIRHALEECARSIASKRYAAAVWPVHQVAELSLKMYISLRAAKHERTHDINRLLASARQAGLVEASPLTEPVQDKAAIGCRTGEVTHVAASDAYAMYRKSLEIAQTVFSQMPRSFRMRNASLLVAKAPWTRFDDSEDRK